MKYSEMRKIKKALGAYKCRQRYHNKHTDGSGNFGYDMYPEKTEGYPRHWFDIHGDYDTEKTIRNLTIVYKHSFSDAGKIPVYKNNNMSAPFEFVVEYIKDFVEEKMKERNN